VLSGRGGGRDGVVRSAEWPLRATGPYRANESHDDARPFDGTHDNGAANVVPDRLSVSLTYGVPFGFAVSFGITGSIEGDANAASTRSARMPQNRRQGVVLSRSARGLHDPVEGQEGAHYQLSHLSCSFLSLP
jgi:hypothetical protein